MRLNTKRLRKALHHRNLRTPRKKKPLQMPRILHQRVRFPNRVATKKCVVAKSGRRWPMKMAMLASALLMIALVGIFWNQWVRLAVEAYANFHFRGAMKIGKLVRNRDLIELRDVALFDPEYQQYAEFKEITLHC